MTWSHPRIEDPRLALREGEFELIAQVAAEALHRRVEAYPSLVKSGRMQQAEANEDIAAWKEIARDWRWIDGGVGHPADVETRYRRRAALDLSIERFFAQLDRTGGEMTDKQQLQIASLAAMRSEVEAEFTGPLQNTARSWANVAHQWRAENGHPPIEVMRQQQNNEKAA